MALSDLPVELVSASQDFRRNLSFKTAATIFVYVYLANFKQNSLLSRITSNEVNQYLIGYLAYMDWHRKTMGGPGATLAGLQRFAAETGLAGHRRVAALVGILRLGKLVAPLRHPNDARIKVMQPTDRAKEIFRKVMRSFQEPIALLRGNNDWLNRLDEPGSAGVDAAMALNGHNFHAGFINYPPKFGAIEELKVFNDKDSALKILLQLYILCDPQNIVIANVSQFAREFSVSRQHVRGVLDIAELNGLLVTLSKTRREVRLQPLLIDTLEIFIALYLAAMAEGARLAFEVSE